MDWGEDQNSVMLICPERLAPGPRAAEPRCPPSARLVPDSAAGTAPLGQQVVQKSCPEAAQAGAGLGAGRGSQGLVHFALFFRQRCRSGNGLERCSMVLGVAVVQPDLFAGSEPPS